MSTVIFQNLPNDCKIIAVLFNLLSNTDVYLINNKIKPPTVNMSAESCPMYPGESLSAYYTRISAYLKTHDEELCRRNGESTTSSTNIAIAIVVFLLFVLLFTYIGYRLFSKYSHRNNGQNVALIPLHGFANEQQAEDNDRVVVPRMLRSLINTDGFVTPQINLNEDRRLRSDN